jgi:UDP:flavonoid glycosyltransferase YjiC (YdhE family)
MVVAPLQEEEAIVARRVATTGAGLAVQLDPPYGDVRADELRDAVESVLRDEQYARRATEIGNGLRAAGGRERAARVVLECARKGRDSASDSPRSDVT